MKCKCDPLARLRVRQSNQALAAGGERLAPGRAGHLIGALPRPFNDNRQSCLSKSSTRHNQGLAMMIWTASRARMPSDRLHAQSDGR